MRKKIKFTVVVMLILVFMLGMLNVNGSVAAASNRANLKKKSNNIVALGNESLQNVTLEASSTNETNGIEDNTIENEDIELRNNSIYCWDQIPLYTNYIDNTIERLNSLNVSDIYFAFDNLENSKEMISKLKESGISIYYLTGDPSWYKSDDNIKEKIDEIYNYNINNADNAISGIVLDVEPYIEEDYKADEITGIETYANTMEDVYAYAKSKNVKLINTVPYWYDNYMTDTTYTKKQRDKAKRAFEKIMKNADKISVMNYYKTKMVDHIENELKYAKEYNLEIESIAEFMRPSGEDIPETCTFYVDEEPIKTANAEWQKIYNEYNYENLNFSYHNLTMILELYNDLTKFVFEFIDENSQVVSTGKYKVVFPTGEYIEKRINSEIELKADEQYNIYLDNYKVQGLAYEVDLGDNTIKRTYSVKPVETYLLEIYAKYLDGDGIADGKIKLINNDTQEEYINEFDNSGEYCIIKNIIAENSYKVIYISKDGEEHILNLATAKDNNGVTQTINDKSGNIVIPEGFKDDFYICTKFIINNTNEVQIEPSQKYSLEIYPKLWNGSKYSSIGSGQIKLVNVATNEEQIATIMGDSNSGFYTCLTVCSNTLYKVYILDEDGKQLDCLLDNVVYKDAQGVEQIITSEDGTITFPNGLNSTIYPKFNMR